jgi:hypothetical protein
MRTGRRIRRGAGECSAHEGESPTRRGWIRRVVRGYPLPMHHKVGEGPGRYAGPDLGRVVELLHFLRRRLGDEPYPTRLGIPERGNLPIGGEVSMRVLGKDRAAATSQAPPPWPWARLASNGGARPSFRPHRRAGVASSSKRPPSRGPRELSAPRPARKTLRGLPGRAVLGHGGAPLRVAVNRTYT